MISVPAKPPVWERKDAVEELNREAYALKAWNRARTRMQMYQVQKDLSSAFRARGVRLAKGKVSPLIDAERPLTLASPPSFS